MVQSLLPALVSAPRPPSSGSGSDLGGGGGLRALLTLLAAPSPAAAAVPLSDAQLEPATRSVQRVTQDARELLTLIVDAVQAHVAPAPSTELAQLRSAHSDAVTRAVRSEEELQRLQRQVDAAQREQGEGLERVRRAEAEERLEREQRNVHRLQLQLHQQQEHYERQLRDAQLQQQRQSLSATPTPHNGSGDDEQQQQQQQQGLHDVLALRQDALEELRAEKAAHVRQLETERAEWGAQSVGAAWDERVRQSAVYRAQEVRWNDAQAREASVRAELEEVRAELSALQTQRRHDAEQRNRLHQAQLVTQEEKIAAMETRVKKLQSERDTLAHELEQRRADKPAAQLLRQLTDELSAQTKRAQEALEQKAAFLERIAELRRTVARLEKGGTTSASAGGGEGEWQRRVETQERENETLLAEMAHMEAELTRVQQDNTRLLRALAEGEEARLHHTLERAAWSKQQQTAARKGELEREKLAKSDERLRAQEATLQQWQSKVSALEQQLRTRGDECSAWQERAEHAEKTYGDLTLLAQDLAQRIEEAHAALHAVHARSLGDAERSAARDRELLSVKEELAVALRRAASSSAEGVRGRGGGGKEASTYLEQQLDTYKRLVRCSVCNDRAKNTVITRCYHCFCKECIDDNLEKRIRKCPGCGTSFGDKDVHSLWL